MTQAIAAGRVLFVDDEEAACRALKRVLERANFEVDVAHDGQAAAMMVNEGTYDVVITDILMPGMTGLELLRVVRERDFDLPVILMTGGPTIESATQAVAYGAFHYLLKPLDLAELKTVTTKAVRLHRLARIQREALNIAGVKAMPVDQMGLDLSLKRCLDDLWMAYQPIIDAKQKTIFAYEALLRSDDKSLPHPGAILEAAATLEKLDDVIEAVTKRVGSDVNEGTWPGLIFVNLHPQDIGNDILIDEDGPLSKFADRVVLEMTERAALGSVADFNKRLALLRERGYRLAIDDLGAGYASLNSFAQLEPEYVKLDMSLVRGIPGSDMHRKLVESMISLCHEMDILVVGEGVETKVERDALIELGCDLLQGYLLARPEKPFCASTWGD